MTSRITRAIVNSVGAGVQSSYIALNYDADYHIFADTGDETQETYEFIETFLIPEMEKQGKELIIVKWWELYDKPYSSMYDYYYDKKGIPTRQFRSCTERFKIRTIRKFLRNQGVEKAEMMLGITTDEIRRVRPSDVQWIENKFPLIDDELSRRDIKQWWQENYDFAPPKSGCYYCPFLPPDRFLKYADKHGDHVAEKIIQLENRAMKKNENLILFGKYPVRTIWEGYKAQTDVTDFFEFDDRCDSGMCFT